MPLNNISSAPSKRGQNRAVPSREKPSVADQRDRRLPWKALLALASAIFVSQTGEFLPGGLIPAIADDLAVEPGLLGLLITVFAVTVVVTAAPLTFITRRRDRKMLVLVSVLVVALANVVVGFAPTFGWMIGGRILGGLAHGLFWAVVATYVIEIVPRDMLGRATAITAAGGSVSAVLGIPLGNALGQAFGWRWAFLLIAGAGVAVAILLWFWLPAVQRAAVVAKGSRPRILADRTLPGIILITALILVVLLGQTSLGPYIALWLEEIAGLAREELPFYLLLTGVAGAVGVVVSGQLYDCFPRAWFAVCNALVVATLVLLPIAAGRGFLPVILVVAFIYTFAFAGLPMMLQTRMMRTASEEMRTLAGAIQATVFNVGIGGGAAIGGLIASGAGVGFLPVFAAIMGTIALVSGLVVDIFMRRWVRG